MQPCQSYSPITYQQPMYQPNFSTQMPMQNPYADRMAQLQQYQQSLQPQPAQMSGTVQQIPLGINGKVVASAESIVANDVPMDGSVAFFPRQDMSEIYAKCWNSDGTIKTVIYRPFMDNPNNSAQAEEKLKIGLSDEVTGAFMQRLDEISGVFTQRFDDVVNRIEKIEKTISAPSEKKQGNYRAKKEAPANE